MLNILLFASAIIINTPNPQPPQPKKPIELYNKEGLITEEKRRLELKKNEKSPHNPKFYATFLERKKRTKFVRSYGHH